MAMSIVRPVTAVLLAAMALAGCNSSSTSSLFGGPKNAPPVQAVDPNPYPTNYRKQIATFLVMQLSESADFHAALISAPVLKPVGDSQRYVACLQFNGHNVRKDKVVIYLAGTLQQYIDPKPEQCGDAAYLPFTELAAVAPDR